MEVVRSIRIAMENSSINGSQAFDTGKKSEVKEIRYPENEILKDYPRIFGIVFYFL